MSCARGIDDDGDLRGVTAAEVALPGTECTWEEGDGRRLMCGAVMGRSAVSGSREVGWEGEGDVEKRLPRASAAP